MKVSESWLREWVNPAIDTDALVAQVTMAGLEVDAVEAVAGEFSGIVIGEITAAEQHPDADKLRVCAVSNGAESFQVVCGAPNARVGIKVPFAMIGAVLPPAEDGKPFKIKRAKLRGVESQGMLCSEAELQLSENHDGLMELPQDAPVGADIRKYLKLDDRIIEIDLTPNRGDCLSIEGVAREVGVLNQVNVCRPVIGEIAAQIDDVLPVQIDAADYCPRYLGRVIKGVDITAATPLWMLEKLRRAGLRSIDPIVDVTNYVLMELGQPMHAFDLAKLDGGIIVRLASAGEELTLLDDQAVTLRDDTLVIADHGKAVALAGIMGGKHSAVGADTQDIFLEAAFFAPIMAAGKARSYGLHTDSSHRYERGVDYNLPARAMRRATALITDICGGQAGPVVEQSSEADLPVAAAVHLRKAQIKRLLGLEIAPEQVEDILTRLGLVPTAVADGWHVAVPSYRFDIAIEADLLEELARIYGYNRLPVSRVLLETQLQPQTETKLSLAEVRRHLVAREYREAITYTFIEPSLQSAFDPDCEGVALANPISADMSVMRTSLLPGLVAAVRHNVNRQRSRVRLFETGLRFVPTDNGLQQQSMLAMVATGSRLAPAWDAGKEMVDFFDVKGDLESILGLSIADGEFSFAPSQRAGMHPGQCAAVQLDGKTVGYIGVIHPTLQAELDLPRAVIMVELELEALLQRGLPSFKPLSRFPEVTRDLAVLVDSAELSCSILEAVRKVGGEYLRDVALFDVYQGKGVEDGKKSLALSLVYRDNDRTLQDDDVNNSVSAIVSHLQSEFGATLRN